MAEAAMANCRIAPTRYRSPLTWLLWFACCLWPACQRVAASESVDQWQMVWGRGWPRSLKDQASGHRCYTHLGADWGLMGPAAESMKLDQGRLMVAAPAGQWAGVWHSLAGLQRESDITLDAEALWPWGMGSAWQSRWVALRMIVRGQATLKVEIKSADGQILWQRRVELSADAQSCLQWNLPSSSLRFAKTLGWVIEPGGRLELESLELGLKHLAADLPSQCLAASLAKVLRCAPAQGGWFKDRAHWPDGAMASVSATGLAVLSMVACAQPPVSILPLERARLAFDAALRQARSSPRALGLLAHFVQGSGADQRIHPGTEFSTVDSALFFHSMLLAAEMLGDQGALSQIEAMIGQIEANSLLLKEGWYSHGVLEDRRTMLPHVWADWGGETALVNCLMAMAGGPQPRPARRPGQVWQGVGFIGEIQSLLHPDFNQAKPDALDRVNWLEARRALLAQQRMAVLSLWPQSPVAEAGVFGLSAGEALGGDAYSVNGSARGEAAELHPHYLLMAWALAGPPSLLPTLGTMRLRGWFAGWGLVESLSSQGDRVQPMQGSLNGAMEALAAYHAWCQLRRIEDKVFAASLRQGLIRRGLRWYYPGGTPGR